LAEVPGETDAESSGAQARMSFGGPEVSLRKF
jgi:hypothetical protein